MTDESTPESSTPESSTPESSAAETGEAEVGEPLSGERQLSEIALPDEHPAIAPFSFLLGRWKGTGKGAYPTIQSFDFLQEVTFSHIGKPYLIYTSRTWRLQTDEDGNLTRDDQGDLVRLAPLAVETGFWRPQPENRVEVLLVHPTGITEIYQGHLTGPTSVEMVTDVVARTETAKPVTAGKRLYGLVPSTTREGEKDLAYAFDMAAMGLPLTPHLWAVLQWDWID
jgi:hypothetical protein